MLLLLLLLLLLGTVLELVGARLAVLLDTVVAVVGIVTATGDSLSTVAGVDVVDVVVVLLLSLPIRRFHAKFKPILEPLPPLTELLFE